MAKRYIRKMFKAEQNNKGQSPEAESFMFTKQNGDFEAREHEGKRLVMQSKKASRRRVMQGHRNMVRSLFFFFHLH